MQKKGSYLKKSQMSELVKRSPKVSKTNKSIFKGPANPNFFGANQKKASTPD